MTRAITILAACAALAGCVSAPVAYQAPIPASYGLEDLEATLGGLAYSIPAQSYAVQANHWAAIDAANQRSAANALYGMGPKTCSAIYGSPGQISCN